MKSSRTALWIAAGGAALLAAVAGVLLYPGFQTWAVRRFLAGRPALGLSVERVSAGLGSVRVEGVHWKRGAASLDAPLVEADIPLWRAAFGRISLDGVVAKGWTLRLDREGGRQAKPASASAAVPHSGWPSLLAIAHAAQTGADAGPVVKPDGFVSGIRLPVGLTIGKVLLQGVVLHPVNGHARESRTVVKVEGGGLSDGRDGRFDFTLAVDLPEESLVDRIDVSGTLTARMDTPKTFSQLSLMAAAEARGAKMPNVAKLALQVNLIRSTPGESYRIELSTEGKSLLASSAQIPSGTGRLGGTWQVNLTDADLEPFALGRKLPLFSARGGGHFATTLGAPDFQVEGDLAGNIDRLERVRPTLAQIGALRFASEFNLTRRGTILRVTGLKAQVERSEPVFEAEALQGFEFDLATAQLKVADSSRDLARITFSDLPLSWLAPYVKPAAASGTGVRGQLLLGAHEGGFQLRTASPLEVDRLGLAWGETQVLRNAAVSLSLSADYSPAGWQMEVRGFRLGNGKEVFATAELRAGALAGEAQTVKVQGRWTLSMPAGFRQPILAKAGAFSSGAISGDLQASLGQTREFLAKVAMSDAVMTRPESRALPDANLEIRGTILADGSMTFQSPIELANKALQRKSSLLVDASIRPSAGRTNADIRAVGGTVYLDDLSVLGAPLAAGRVRSPEVAQAVQGARDAAPVWQGYAGSLQVSLKRLVVNPRLEISELSGNAALADDTLSVKDLRAKINETCAFSAKGTLAYSKSDSPYDLRSEISVSGFDSSWLLGADAGSVNPTLEAKFDANGELEGSGATLGATIERLRGKLTLLSKGGRFRLLRADVSDMLRSRDTLGGMVVSSIGSLLGKSNKGGETGRLDEYSRMVSEVAAFCSDIRFDQMSVVAVRDASLDVKLQEFTMISPQLRIVGTGGIAHKEGQALSQQPLELQLKLGFRGRMAEIFGKAKLFDGKTDELGYSLLPDTVTIRGSLAAPDTSEFRSLLRKILLARAGEAIWEKLLGR